LFLNSLVWKFKPFQTSGHTLRASPSKIKDLRPLDILAKSPGIIFLYRISGGHRGAGTHNIRLFVFVDGGGDGPGIKRTKQAALGQWEAV